MRTSTDENPGMGPLRGGLRVRRPRRGRLFEPAAGAPGVEAAPSSLVAAIEGHDLESRRIETRLAGGLRNPDVLPALIRALRLPDLSSRVETIRALSDALESDLEEIAAAASQAISSSEAIPHLHDVLESSLHDARTKLGCTLIEGLRRGLDERSAPPLCAILERRPVLHRAHWHALLLAPVDALADAERPGNATAG